MSDLTVQINLLNSKLLNLYTSYQQVFGANDGRTVFENKSMFIMRRYDILKSSVGICILFC